MARISGSFDLRDLEAFVAVADSASFTTAAQSLFLSQPTISARIATLETALDTKLFDRGAGKVRLTPAGTVLLPRARALLHGRDDALQALEAFLGRLAGRLRIGASSIPGTYLLPRLVAELCGANPDLRVTLNVDDSDKAFDALRREDVEIAVIGRPAAEAGFEDTAVAEDEIVLVALPQLARQVAASKSQERQAILTTIPLILRETGSGTRSAVLNALEQEGLDVSSLKVSLEIGGNSASKEAVLGGIGAAFLSRLCVEEELKSGRLEVLNVFSAPLRRPLYLVTRSGRTLSPAASGLVALLEKGRKGQGKTRK